MINWSSLRPSIKAVLAVCWSVAMVQLKSITGLELSVILVIKYSMNSSINQVSGEENWWGTVDIWKKYRLKKWNELITVYRGKQGESRYDKLHKNWTASGLMGRWIQIWSVWNEGRAEVQHCLHLYSMVEVLSLFCVAFHPVRFCQNGWTYECRFWSTM